MWSWWRHQTETFSALLALCAGNSPVTGDFPTQRPVTPSFDVFFGLRLKKRLSKQSWGWWFETPSRSLWCPCNVDAREGDWVSHYTHTRIHAGRVCPQQAAFQDPWWRHQMETSSAFLAFCAGEVTDHRWIPRTKASIADLWCFLWSAPE